MGVIKKTECSIGITSSVSEETLYIPSSDDEISCSGAESERPGRTPRHHRHRVPTVGGSFSAPRSRLGKKKSRRYHNVSQLVTLTEEDELEEVSIQDFVGNSKTPFSVLLEDENCLQKWDQFISSSEEVQEKMLKDIPLDNKKNSVCSNDCTAKPLQMKLSVALRTLLKKKNVPLGMLKYLEDDLVTFFSSMPTNVYVSRALSSFERLLLHSLSDYHRLASLSFDSEPDKLRLVKVTNPRDVFPAPEPLLVQYLETLYKW